MSGTNPEPKCLREGKAFHKKVQAEWEADAEGDVRTEMTVKKDGAGTGRLDVFVSDSGSEVRAIVEIKHSDWDKMTPPAVRRNVKRQALVAPAENRRREYEMAGAGNRQKFSQALHDGEYDNLQPAHSVLRRAVPGVIKCASCRQM